MTFITHQLKRNWKIILLLALNLLALAFFAPLRNFLIQRIIDAKAMDALLKSVIVVLALCLLVFLLESLSNISQASALKNINFNLRREVYNQIISNNLATFRKNITSDYINTLTTDMRIISDDCFTPIFEVILYTGFILVSIIMLASVHVGLLMIVLFQSVIIIVLPRVIGGRLQKLRAAYSQSVGQYISRIKDFFTGFEVIKTFHIEEKVKQGHDEINESLADVEYKFSRMNMLGQSATSFINYIFFVFITASSMVFLLRGHITFGQMIAATQMMIFITTPAAIISRNLIRIKSTMDIVAKVESIMNSKPVEDGKMHVKGFNSSIVIDRVDYSYDGKNNVLRDISCTFEKGKKYAIVGTSGSGKSTLIKLILKYYSEYSGSIRFDDTEISEITNESFTNLCQTIPQGVFLFNDTIRNNICLYKNYSPDEINEAVKKSGLEHVIQASDSGLDEMVREDGGNFSGGEKQRVAIARALVRKPAIIVLDEATSGLDNITAYRIEEDLISLEDLTLLVVTHKYNKNTLSKYDQILCLKDGKIAESGTFDELIDKKGIFYGLYSIQL